MDLKIETPAFLFRLEHKNINDNESLKLVLCYQKRDH